jgi:membrane fusion protein (multidrug efflux system)
MKESLVKRNNIITASVIALGLLAVGTGLYVWKMRSIKAAMNAPAPPEFAEAVTTVPVGSVRWRPMAELAGTIIATQSITLAAEVGGTVKEVKFESGSMVKQGDVLLMLDATTEEADLAAAEASVRVADANIRVVEAQVSLAETNVRRWTQAVDAKAGPQAELDTAVANLATSRADVDRVKAELESAKARVEQVRSQLAKKTLRAPFNSRVGMRNVHPGQYLAEGATMVGLQEVSDSIFVDFPIPQDQLFRVNVGDVVEVTSDVLGSQPVGIEVVAIDAAANSSTRNIRVRGKVSNTDGKLRPGMFLDITVPIGPEKEYLAVPSTAIRRASFGDHVFVVTESKDKEKDKAGTKRAYQRFIKLGPTIGDKVIVMEGLTAGEEIASDGSFKLRDGALIPPAMPPMPPEAEKPATAPDAGK